MYIVYLVYKCYCVGGSLPAHRRGRPQSGGAHEMASAAAAGATNDKTGSIFITKSGFDAAASENKLDANLAAALWATLANSSSQRIIGGATAPRDDAANVNQWHWSEVDLLPWAKERFEELLVGKIEAHGVPDKGWVKINKMEHCKGEASVSNR